MYKCVRLLHSPSARNTNRVGLVGPATRKYLIAGATNVTRYIYSQHLDCLIGNDGQKVSPQPRSHRILQIQLLIKTFISTCILILNSTIHK